MPENIETLTTESTLLIPGLAGEIEVLLSPAPPISKKNLAVICHPHPLYGGTMHNKVVTTLSKTFQQLNMQTIRFNFRGVGGSSGAYGEGDGEQDDLLAVLAWLKLEAPEAKVWLAGFSFGAYIAIRTAAEMSFEGLVTIAPPVNHFKLDNLPEINCPWIVVQGGKDDVVPAAEVLAWLDKLKTKPTLIEFPEAGHFFHGGLTALRESLVSKLSQLL